MTRASSTVGRDRARLAVDAEGRITAPWHRVGLSSDALQAGAVACCSGDRVVRANCRAGGARFLRCMGRAHLSTQARAPGHCSNVMLAVAAPTLAQNPPTGQSSQLVELVPELNEPGGHAVQLTLAASAVYWPGRHGRQTAPVTGSAIVPLEQSAQRGAAQVAGSVLTRSGKDES